MLAQLALLVFAIFAVLALVIDVGLARVTQAGMQNAADSAAIEGLRRRDVGVVNPANGQTVNDPFASDCQRRTAAYRVTSWTFDDDFDTTDGDAAYNFGAGPLIDLTGGQTNLHANETMSVPERGPVYDPQLQFNQQNHVYGDMVSGRFCYSADPLPSEGIAYSDPDAVVCTEQQRGEGAYARSDFNPAPSSPLPPSSLTGCPAADDAPPDPWPIGGTGSISNVQNSAFLVRLRRSNEFTDLDAQTEEGVATSGPAIPFLFGRGTLMHGDDSAYAYSPRRDGITVRATAIAQARPALRVGLPMASPAEPGVMPVAFADTFVQTLNAATTQVTINPANGLVCRGTTCAGVTPATSVGRFVDALTDPTRARWRLVSTVGQPLPGATAMACAPNMAFSGFGPVYSQMASGATRIVGFSRIDVTRDPARPGPANACAMVVARGASLVAAANATAVVSGGLPLPAGTPAAELTELLDKNLVRNGAVNYAPVLAPVLAR